MSSYPLHLFRDDKLLESFSDFGEWKLGYVLAHFSPIQGDLIFEQGRGKWLIYQFDNWYALDKESVPPALKAWSLIL